GKSGAWSPERSQGAAEGTRRIAQRLSGGRPPSRPSPASGGRRAGGGSLPASGGRSRRRLPPPRRGGGLGWGHAALRRARQASGSCPHPDLPPHAGGKEQVVAPSPQAGEGVGDGRCPNPETGAGR